MKKFKSKSGFLKTKAIKYKRKIKKYAIAVKSNIPPMIQAQ